MFGASASADYLDQRASDLPLGIRQRLSLAVAIVHEPEMLILDEPTSGVDPLARDRFWELLIDLSRNQGVTIFVSTHFMNEAERCDRIALMHAGRVLATDTPAAVTQSARRRNPRRRLHQLSRGSERVQAPRSGGARRCRRKPAVARLQLRPRGGSKHRAVFSLRRLLAYTIRETLELLRDPIRLSFALFGTAFLMLSSGSASRPTSTISPSRSSTATRRRRAAPISRNSEARAISSRKRRSPIMPISTGGLRSGDIKAGDRNPPGLRPRHQAGTADLGRRLGRRRDAVPRRDDPRLSAGHASALSGRSRRWPPTVQPARRPPPIIEIRFNYNQDFDSVYAMVPSTMALLLALFPAILMALAIVREKELGSITNLYVTPVTRIEFLLGKQLPYIAVALVNFAVMFLMALFVFQVPLKGSFPTLRSAR